MLLATELVPSSQVSTRGVPYPSPSCNIPLDQYKVIRNDSVASFEPARIPVAMAGFITVNDVQEAASRESMGSVAAGGGWLAVMPARAPFWWMLEMINLKKEKRLFEARYHASDRWRPVWGYGLLSCRVAVC